MLEKGIEILMIALTGYVFTHVLMKGDMIFGFYFRFLDDKVKVKSEKVADMLGLCVYCFTGQLALWYFVLTRWIGIERSYFEIIGFISVAIFIIVIIKKRWKI